MDEWWLALGVVLGQRKSGACDWFVDAACLGDPLNQRRLPRTQRTLQQQDGVLRKDEGQLLPKGPGRLKGLK